MTPYTYPSFKIHKLSEEEIQQKKLLSARLIHASKNGPLYRTEKWTDPYLTEISRNYCDNVLDTKHLWEMVDELNNTQVLRNKSFNLLTIDVVS